MAKFHGSYRWKRLRRIARIEAQHICAQCGGYFPNKGQLHIHHRKAVEHAPALAFEPQNFMVVCGPCHNAIEPRSGSPRVGGCDITGRPLDPRHPFYKAP